MMLKMTTAVLMITGLLGGSSAAAVAPLQVSMSMPVPGFNMANQAANMAVSAPSGLAQGLDIIKAASAIIPMQSSGMFSINITFPSLTVSYDPATSSFGFARQTAKLMLDMSGVSFNLTMKAAATAAGECEMGMTMAPNEMDKGMGMSGFNFFGNAAGLFRSYMTGLMDAILPPILKPAVKAFLDGPKSPITSADMCKAMVDSSSPPNPFSC